MTLSPTRNYSNCTFPRLTLHACALTHTISLSYWGISLSFHLVTEVFQLVMCYFIFPVQFQLNSDFSHSFLNGQPSVISIALQVLLIPNSTGYPCYHSLIVGQFKKKSFAIIATLYRSLTISLFQDSWNFVFNVRPLLICCKTFRLIRVEVLW